jgi:hypothetical protein
VGEAGLNDIFMKQTITGQSSVLWSQNLSQNIGGTWSWQDARRYFYIALTGLEYDGEVLVSTPKEKEGYFANTFRAVGHLMHLVHDASVPEHVRNDIHIKPAYEAFVNEARTKRPTIWNDWIRNPITFDKSILEIFSSHPAASVPISRIIDTDIYVGDNPNTTITLLNSQQPIGIAEYTNVNFLSPDTMFTDDLPSDHRHYSPYPKASSTYIWRDLTNKRRYLRKEGAGDSVDHLAAVSLIYSYRRKFFPQYNEKLPIGLDGGCYDEYASRLIPRAVGYSAGLLKYFFRGELQVSALPIFYKNGIQYVRVNIKNMTPTEETMENGYFALAYRYTPKDDPTDG